MARANIKKEKNIAVTCQGKGLLTPDKHELAVPSQALADAIAAEWQTHAKFDPHKMPLTLLAYTAIDRIAGQENNIVEVLMAYVDTDTLSYRSSSGSMQARQKSEWDPLLQWAGKEFKNDWQTTTGVMALDQSASLHQSVRDYLQTFDALQLAVCSILASTFSSLVLAMAVMKGHVDAETGFRLSRLEEDAQAEQWGRDEEADRRAARVKEDIIAAGRFLGLLDSN